MYIEVFIGKMIFGIVVKYFSREKEKEEGKSRMLIIVEVE